MIQPDDPRSTLLVTVTGPDRPGVTARLFGALAELQSGVRVAPVTPMGAAGGPGPPATSAPAGMLQVIDVEQVVVHGRLVLGVVLATGVSTEIIAAALGPALNPFGLAVSVTGPQADPPTVARRVGGGRVHVTVLGHPLLADAVAAVAGCIADSGANIDRIDRLAAYPVTSVEFQASGVADPGALRESLAVQAAATGIDVAVQPAGLHRRAKRLVVMDVDSTLVQGEVIEMLAERAGVLGEVARVTEAAMRGELDFEASLRARVALLAGLDAAEVQRVRDSVALTPGARTLVRTLKRLGYRVAAVSGGFTQVTDHLAADLGLDYVAANTLEVADGRLTGGLVGPIVDRAYKATALRQFAEHAGVPLAQTIAVGDGANDLDMLATAGLGVAFCAKPIVREAADTAVSVPYLDSVLYLLGITREEIEGADAADDLSAHGSATP